MPISSITKIDPDNGYFFISKSVIPIDAVVIYNLSRLLPPKVKEVGLGIGRLIILSIEPSGKYLVIQAPSQCALQTPP